MGGGPRPPSSDHGSISDRSSGDAIEVSTKPREAMLTDRASPSVDGSPVQQGGQGVPFEGESTFGERASSEREEGGEQERARLLYSKSKVYLHPSSYLRDNIPGFISIVQIGSSTKPNYLLAWIPEASIQGTPDFESYVLVELFASHESEPTLVTLPPPSSAHAFSIPIPSLYSLVIQPPTLSSWFGSVTFNLFDGQPLPPLYFHDEESRSTVLDRDRRAEALGVMGAQESWSPGSPLSGTSKIPPSWGGEAILSQLRQYAHIVRSKLEPQLFLVNPSREDLDVHSTALFEDEAVPNEAMFGLGLAGGNMPPGAREKREGKRTSILHQSLEAGDYPDVVSPSMDNFTFNVLNSFSRITRGARSAAQNAAQSVLSHPLAKPILKNIPEPLTQPRHANGELTRHQENAGVGQYDAARVYLAKWAQVVAEEGERARRAEYVFSGPGGRQEDSEVGAFEVLSSTYRITRPKSTRASATPIVVTEWAAWFDDDGTLMLSEAEAKKRIFQRGLADDVRKDVWPFLLKVFPWTSSTKDRRALKGEKSVEYARLKSLWLGNEELQSTALYTEEKHRVEIDCLRTDRTHPMFECSKAMDPSEWGESAHPPSNDHVKKMQEILLTWVFAEEGRNYVQGMSDLLSPLYVVADADEVLTLSMFVTVMERMKGNFLRDQSGMKRQLSELQSLLALMDPQLHKHLELTGSLNLFFCFRWILCSFKRELSFEGTLQLWEILWTDYLGEHFHLFFALAIIEAHRDVIIRYLREFDEVLKYVNELSHTIDVDALLADAEVLYLTFRKVIAASDADEARRIAASPAIAQGGLRRRKANGKGKEKAIPEEEGDEKDLREGDGGADEEADDSGEDEEEPVVAEPPEIDETLRSLLT